jgi:hypothetical protein
VAGGVWAAAQQDSSSTPAGTKVLQIQREFVKPGKQGAMHDKTEMAFAAAMSRAKWPTHYVGFCSMSGRSRCVYLTWYESFAAWEADSQAVSKNATLSAELEHAGVADGELLDSMSQVVYTYDKDLSYHSRPPNGEIRYLEASVYHVKPGHAADWNELVKMVKDGNDKAGTSAHWGMYDISYGAEDDTYLILTADKSMADIDNSIEDSKKWVAAMGGPAGLKKFNELLSAAVDHGGSELFAVNPKQSYPEDEWVKADSGFWKPKTEAPAAKAAVDAKKAKQ